MPDQPRTRREAGLLAMMARQTGVQDNRPDPLADTMDRQAETLQTPYALRRAEAHRAMMEYLRVEETDEMMGPWRVLRPIGDRKVPEEADHVRDEEEI